MAFQSTSARMNCAIRLHVFQVQYPLNSGMYQHQADSLSLLALPCSSTKGKIPLLVPSSVLVRCRSAGFRTAVPVASQRIAVAACNLSALRTDQYKFHCNGQAPLGNTCTIQTITCQLNLASELVLSYHRHNILQSLQLAFLHASQTSHSGMFLKQAKDNAYWSVP